MKKKKTGKIQQRIPYYESLRKTCLLNAGLMTLQLILGIWLLVPVISGFTLTTLNILGLALIIAAVTWILGAIIRELKKARDYRLKSRTIKNNKEL